MKLRLASIVHPQYQPSSRTHNFFSLPPPLRPDAPRKRFRPRCLASQPTGVSAAEILDLENSKYNLLRAIQDTQRGLVTTPDQRSSIEEALVGVESYDAGLPIQLAKLDGTWRLQYTSAPDVLILFNSASKLPFFQVGQIFQKFECQGQNDGGYVRNVVRWSITNLFEEQEGATLLVSAKFSVVSSRNIYLQFEEIAVQNINISEELQAIIAPAMLPRTFLSLQRFHSFLQERLSFFTEKDFFIHGSLEALPGMVQPSWFYQVLILQSIRSFKAQVPVRNPGTGRQSVGGLYYLSYLDSNMLLGRAVGGGGVFIFTRAHTVV